MSSSQRLLKVAIVGLPNAGKSTLVNNIMSLVVCPVSKRVHTTRVNQHATYLEHDTQVVFVDTPGLVNVKEIKKFAFPKDFVFGPEKSCSVADVIAVMHDISHNLTRNKLDPRIKGLLEKFPNKESILILNKIDTVKRKGTLLDTVRYLTCGVVGGKAIQLKKAHSLRVKDESSHFQMDNLMQRARIRAGLVDNDQNFLTSNIPVKTSFLDDEIREGLDKVGWPNFQDIFMISALHGKGVELVKNYFVANAKPSQWMFEDDFLTDVKPQELTIRMLKSLMLDQLPQEIPYKLEPSIEFWEPDESGDLKVIIKLECPNSRYVGRIVGTGGTVIRRLTEQVESMLSNLLRKHVNLAINLLSVEKKAEGKK